MSDFILIPVSDTEAVRVQFPLALPREDRPAFVAALDLDALAEADRVPLPSAPPVAPSTPTED